MLLFPHLQRRWLLAWFLPALVWALAASVAAAGEADGARPEVALLPEREVLPLLQAWRRAEEDAAVIPGAEAMVGRGDSMLPMFPDATVLVVQRMRMEELRAGMVVVFVGDGGRPVAHTLVANGPRGWLAKGMANEHFDGTRVRSQNYLGTVVKAFVPFLPEARSRATPVGAGAGEITFSGRPPQAATRRS